MSKRTWSFRILSVALGLFAALLALVVLDVLTGWIMPASYFTDHNPFGRNHLGTNLASPEKVRALKQRSRYGSFPVSPAADSESHPSEIHLSKRLLPTEFEPLGSFRNVPGTGVDYLAKSVVAKKFRGSPEQKELIYQRQYTIEMEKRRVVPGQDKKKAEEFLVFVGCSFTFGEGVNDNETMAYYASQLLPQRKVYNYGLMGGSPGEAAFFLRSIKVPEEVPEKTGTVIYTFIDDHIRRVVGTMRYISDYGFRRPHYFIDDQNQFRFAGSQENARPLRTFIFRALAKSKILRVLKIDLPWTISKRDMEFTARSIEEIQKAALEHLHARDFYVLLYPEVSSDRGFELMELLEAKGIRYIYYGDWDMNRITGGKKLIENEVHPTPQSYRAVVGPLKEILR
jgi:hypothetical protein